MLPSREFGDGPALSAVLFDLDGTLLDIDGEGFLDSYVEALAAHWGPPDLQAFRQAVMAASVPIFSEHPDLCNGQVFRQHLARHLGIEPSSVWSHVAAFHAEALRAIPVEHRPIPEARRCVERCLERGLRVAVATTPIYTDDVIRLRLSWAGVEDLPWALITHSENMHTCKPAAAYFAEVASLLGVDPAACVMVGDDLLQDGPARKVGMPALLRAGPGVDGWSSLEEVAATLDDLADTRRSLA